MKYGDGVQDSNVVPFIKASKPSCIDLKAANDDNSDSDNSALAEKTITLRKRLDDSDCVITVKVPAAEYIGVAVSTTISEEGILTSAIELVHPDADFNYQVFEETGNTQIIAEWQNWGRQLRLPLFIRSGDGELVPYSQQVDGVMLGQSSARRKTASESARRPRFLHRRK
ncbi:MAG: DUF6101 family protein [Devosiaceae bacterium]|nr:DUF6101 family protein [Devosiaceae bacterium]